MLFEHFIAQSTDFKGTELSQITEAADLGAVRYLLILTVGVKKTYLRHRRIKYFIF